MVINQNIKNNDSIIRVSNLIKYQSRSLIRTLYIENRNDQYKKIEIPKKNGNIRILHSVFGPLKRIQTNTLSYLSTNYEPSKYAHGFVKGKSIITNAKLHINKKIIIRIDIKDFFPSITFARLHGMFQKYPFNFSESISTIFSQISCLEEKNGQGSIPQGGVMSPYISNMICRKLDSRIGNFAKKNHFTFTRYADDIIISTNKSFNIDKTVNLISKIIKEENFTINESKTRVMKKSGRQSVTGIIVNDGLNINKKYYKNLRGILHNCLINGLEENIFKYENNIIWTKEKFHIQKNYTRCPNLYKYTVTNKNSSEKTDLYTTYSNNESISILEDSVLAIYKNKKESKDIYFSKLYSSTTTMGKFAIACLEPVKNKKTINKLSSILELNSNTVINNKIKGQKNILKHMFFTHLKGRVDFIGQIAKSSDKNELKYKLRIERYKKLKRKLEKIQNKEALEFEYLKSGKQTLKNYFNSDIYKSLINKVDSISTKPSLQAIMTELKKIDMRFFDKSFIKEDTSIDEIKNKIKKNIKFPAFDLLKLYNFLYELTSSEHVLGKVVHRNTTVKFEELYKMYKEFHSIIYYLDWDSRNLIKGFIENIKKQSVLTDDKDNLKFWEDEKFLNEYIIPFKEKTRVQNSEGTKKNLFNSLITNELNDKVNINWNIDGFYGPVDKLAKSLNLISQSMLKEERENSISICISSEESSDFSNYNEIIKITINGDNTDKYFPNIINRTYAHGKTNEVIKNCYGIAHYHVIVKHNSKLTICIDMMDGSGNSVTEVKGNKIKSLTSFNHVITFPKVESRKF